MSHGSRELGTEMLPVDNLDGINPETQGVIVDNFLPGVGAVIVYTSEYSGGESSVDVKYMAKWVLKSDLDTSEYMEQIEY
ncbi:MAG: hypothetical protein KAH31_10495, partial [Candidatus Sabulitectum sp.]|nr:hypothetical protein [Candidatus Sabulitectum sp.]